ncbi:hypothetical protein EJ05DRAFT_31986 [Pseudovirgaria hyperparasitica]|uniref:F-box domain-containing protein n=1 Tax=Pseudovirgaria hyperparasitica TaxID=470096 RepID=A0A6A6WM32_9PEZI|nr:uncharacterized protein EJ05DRAFT_31986 [Pseudovirgaria hyperparasitica]KAF2763261.1 hypothetical protein EJ05DRAFT_31986 [Pseudovirgaria hyperparasitica]
MPQHWMSFASVSEQLKRILRRTKDHPNEGEDFHDVVPRPGGKMSAQTAPHLPDPFKDRLTRLPNELLFQITSYLSESDKGSVARTCVQLFRLLHTDKFKNDRTKCIRGRGARIYRQLFSCERCRAHDQATGPRSYRLRSSLWCSGCGVHHWWHYFSDEQREMEDKKRTCIGRRGSIRVCPHRDLSYNDLKDIRRQNDISTPSAGLVLCEAPDHRHGKQPTLFFEEDGYASIINVDRVATLESDTRAARSSFKDTLLDTLLEACVAAPICPHIGALKLWLTFKDTFEKSWNQTPNACASGFERDQLWPRACMGDTEIEDIFCRPGRRVAPDECYICWTSFDFWKHRCRGIPELVLYRRRVFPIARPAHSLWLRNLREEELKLDLPQSLKHNTFCNVPGCNRGFVGELKWHHFPSEDYYWRPDSPADEVTVDQPSSHSAACFEICHRFDRGRWRVGTGSWVSRFWSRAPGEPLSSTSDMESKIRGSY